MSGVIVILGTVYGLTALAAAGGGVAWYCSAAFRHSIMGDRQQL